MVPVVSWPMAITLDIITIPRHRTNLCRPILDAFNICFPPHTNSLVTCPANKHAQDNTIRGQTTQFPISAVEEMRYKKRELSGLTPEFQEVPHGPARVDR